jgi:alpha-N-acetylglucosamine transferase
MSPSQPFTISYWTLIWVTLIVWLVTVVFFFGFPAYHRPSWPAPVQEQGGEPTSRTRYAVATLASNRKYYLYALALLRSFADVTKKQVDNIILVPELAQKTTNFDLNLANQLNMLVHIQSVPSELTATRGYFEKLALWNLTQYDRVIYIDADSTVIHNIDDLFELPEEFYGSPDAVTCKLVPDMGFCAGFFVLKPNKARYDDLKSYWAKQPSRWVYTHNSEQTMLNFFFREIGEHRLLSPSWNAWPWQCDCGLVDHELKTAHFLHWTIDAYEEVAKIPCEEAARARLREKMRQVLKADHDLYEGKKSVYKTPKAI